MQASSPGYWQSGMGLDSSMQAKTPRILVIKHEEGYFDRRAQMNSSKIVSSQCFECEQTKEYACLMVSSNISRRRKEAETEQNFK